MRQPPAGRAQQTASPALRVQGIDPLIELVGQGLDFGLVGRVRDAQAWRTALNLQLSTRRQLAAQFAGGER